MVKRHIPYYNSLEHYGKPTCTSLQYSRALWYTDRFRTINPVPGGLHER